MKIRKQYKNEDGTITEVEGTEEEIAKYEKKRDKKKDEGSSKKKDILYGKEIVYVPVIVTTPPSQPVVVPQYPSYPWYTWTCDSNSPSVAGPNTYSNTTYSIKC